MKLFNVEEDLVIYIAYASDEKLKQLRESCLEYCRERFITEDEDDSEAKEVN